MFEFISGIVAILEVCVCVCMCVCVRVCVCMSRCVCVLLGYVDVFLITFYAIERHVACQTSLYLNSEYCGYDCKHYG